MLNLKSTMKKKILTPNAPKAIGPYSQAVACHGFLFVSGQIPINPKTQEIEEKTIEGQTKQVLANIEAILIEAGLSFDHVAKCEIFVIDIKDFPIINALYAEKFHNGIQPARQLVEVSALPKGSLIEISCIAHF